MKEKKLTYYDLQKIAFRWLYRHELDKFRKFATQIDLPVTTDINKYSYLYNALFRGIYEMEIDYNYKHTNEEVRAVKGLKPTSNVPDAMPAMELRIHSYAMNLAKEKLLELKYKGETRPTVIADELHKVGKSAYQYFTRFNDKRMAVNYLANQTGPLRTRTLIKHFDNALKRGNVSEIKKLRPVKIEKNDHELEILRMTYAEYFDEVKKFFENIGVADVKKRKELFEAIEEGYYNTDFLNKKDVNIINDIKNIRQFKEDNVEFRSYNKQDLIEHVEKIKTVMGHFKNNLSKIKSFDSLKNLCLDAGTNARENMITNRQTLPEFSYFFTASVTRDRIRAFETEQMLNQSAQAAEEPTTNRVDESKE